MLSGGSQKNTLKNNFAMSDFFQSNQSSICRKLKLKGLEDEYYNYLKKS
jgi:hypothetical protein